MRAQGRLLEQPVPAEIVGQIADRDTTKSPHPSFRPDRLGTDLSEIQQASVTHCRRAAVGLSRRPGAGRIMRQTERGSEAAIAGCSIRAECGAFRIEQRRVHPLDRLLVQSGQNGIAGRTVSVANEQNRHRSASMIAIIAARSGSRGLRRANRDPPPSAPVIGDIVKLDGAYLDDSAEHLILAITRAGNPAMSPPKGCVAVSSEALCGNTNARCLVHQLPVLEPKVSAPQPSEGGRSAD
jgi:hypothetical protein